MLLIANRDAGGTQENDLEVALNVLRAATDVEVCRTSNPGELDGVLQRAGSRTVVVAGGDGSLHAVVAALHKRNELDAHTLGLIPLGTGNDFARTLELPLEPAAAAQALLEGSPTAMDLIVDEVGQIVVNNVHAGASALASKRGARWKERLGKVGLGVLGYPIGAVSAAIKPPYVRLRIEADGEVVADMDQHVFMVAIGNGASVGGGAEITPDADPSDGRLDVMISFTRGPIERLQYAWHIRNAEHDERDDVRTLRARQVTITGEEFWISADGELSGPESRRSWHLEPGAYRLVTPPPLHDTDGSAATGSSGS